MHSLIKDIIKSVLFEKKKPTSQTILDAYPQLAQKNIPMFVTIFDGEKVVASAGRLYPMSNSADELVQSTIQAIEDPRFQSYRDNPEKIQLLTMRIDTFEDADRRLLHHPDDIQVGKEGMIIICRSQKKVGVVLPGMLPANTAGQDMYHILAKKIDLDTQKLKKGDLIVYGLTTKISQGI